MKDNLSYFYQKNIFMIHFFHFFIHISKKMSSLLNICILNKIFLDFGNRLLVFEIFLEINK